MTTNNPLDQNSENAEKHVQEENSNQRNEKQGQEETHTEDDPRLSAEPVKPRAKKKKSEIKDITSNDSAAPDQEADVQVPPQSDAVKSDAAGAKKKSTQITAAKKPRKAKTTDTDLSGDVPSGPAVEKAAKPKATKKSGSVKKVEIENTEGEHGGAQTAISSAAPLDDEKLSKPTAEEPSSEPEIANAPEKSKTKRKAKTKSDKPADHDPSIDEIPVDDAEDHDEEDHDEDDSSEEEALINYDALGLEELVGMLEKIVQEEEISALRKKVALIKVAFLRKHKAHQEEKLEIIAKSDDEEETGEEEKDVLGDRFNEAFNIYSEKRKAYLDQQEVQKQKNMEGKMMILEELKALIESEESLKKTYDDFKELQDKWKAIGMVPKGEVNNLWQNYHFYVEKFFDKVKINKELRDLDLKKNMETKIDLCEKAEELLLEPSVLKSFKQLQQYHRLWKEVGPVPQDKKDELWDRFRSTTEKINNARRDHYNQMKEEQEVNLVSKTALCVKAEELLQKENNTIKEWQESTRMFSELLKEWKQIGQAPRKENDEIWDRFKASLDAFFSGKKEYFQGIKDEQLNNYNLKLDLCSQAEAVKNSTDWKETTRELITLQNEWKKIGPVPRKHSEKIWQRFRAACDDFFNSKSEYFANRKTNETDNLRIKEDLIKKVESFEYGNSKSGNLELLKGFQREWTEIGHVPFKEKDRLQNEFRKAINDKLDQLKISKTEMQTVNYKQRFENIREKPQAGRIVRNEKYGLQLKVKKMEDEIQLLENNMGFLAKSKKADLLKEEFAKKIENIRNEVVELKEKIKFLERETE